MKKIKIYLIARISPEAHNWNNKVADSLDSNTIEIFKPHDHNPWDTRHEKLEKAVFEVDLKETKESDIGLCLPEFGNDCSWECGWFSNSNKPLVAFVGAQTGWLRDWMIKGGLGYVITDNQNTFQQITNDPILKDKKIFLVTDNLALSDILLKIYKDNYKKSKIISLIANLRPYSWGNLIIIGYLAKTIKLKELTFSWSDIFFITALLSMWIFYNSLLEIKHNYEYRAKLGYFVPLAAALIVLIIAASSYVSILFVFVVFLLNYLYLLKQNNNTLRLFSPIIRGAIESSYFLFTFIFLGGQLSSLIVNYTLIIFIIYALRSFIGDLRDFEHNKTSGKNTLAILLGKKSSEVLILMSLFSLIFINLITNNNNPLTFILITFSAAIIVSRNWYILHQASIIFTTFIIIAFIAQIASLPIMLFNLIYLGVILNLVFYPILERKSNPLFNN